MVIAPPLPIEGGATVMVPKLLMVRGPELSMLTVPAVPGPLVLIALMVPLLVSDVAVTVVVPPVAETVVPDGIITEDDAPVTDSWVLPADETMPVGPTVTTLDAADVETVTEVPLALTLPDSSPTPVTLIA